MKDCPLCDMEELTTWHYVDDRFIICDCLTCHSPMVVYRLHQKSPSEQEKLTILHIAEKIFKKPVRFRGYTRQIPMEQHWHEHIIL